MPVQNQNLNQVFHPALALPMMGPPTPPPTGEFILMENSGYILQENGDRILLE